MTSFELAADFFFFFFNSSLFKDGERQLGIMLESNSIGVYLNGKQLLREAFTVPVFFFCFFFPFNILRNLLALSETDV